MAIITLNTNSIGAASSIAITTETTVSLFIVGKTGSNNNHRIGLEASPDSGTTWIEIKKSITGLGCKTFDLPVCTNIRLKVLKSEGVTSTVDVHLLMR